MDIRFSSLSLSLNLDNLTGFNIILMALQSDGQTRGVVTAECQPRSIKKRNDHSGFLIKQLISSHRGSLTIVGQWWPEDDGHV